MKMIPSEYCEDCLLDAFVATILCRRVGPHWVMSYHAIRNAELLHKAFLHRITPHQTYLQTFEFAFLVVIYNYYAIDFY